MRRVDDSITLITSLLDVSARAPTGWAGTGPCSSGSTRSTTSRCTPTSATGPTTSRILGFGRDLDDRIDVVKGLIQAARVTNPQARPIYIAFDEWNVWYRTLVPGSTEYQIARTGLEEHYNFEDALGMGVFLNAFFRHADVVKLANLAQLVNVIAPMFTNPQGLYLQTVSFPIAEYAKQRDSSRSTCSSSRPSSRIAGARSVTWTCRRPTTRRASRCT